MHQRSWSILSQKKGQPMLKFEAVLKARLWSTPDLTKARIQPTTYLWGWKPQGLKPGKISLPTSVVNLLELAFLAVSRVGKTKFRKERRLGPRTLALTAIPLKPATVKKDGRMDFATEGQVRLEESRGSPLDMFTMSVYKVLLCQAGTIKITKFLSL